MRINPRSRNAKTRSAPPLRRFVDYKSLIANDDIPALQQALRQDETILQPVLQHLVQTQNKDTIRILLESVQNFDFSHALLQETIKTNDISLVKEILEELPDHFELRLSDLTTAAKITNEEMLRYLLGQKLSPLIDSDWKELQQLLKLVFNFSTDVVEQLLFRLRDSSHYERIYAFLYREAV